MITTIADVDGNEHLHNVEIVAIFFCVWFVAIFHIYLFYQTDNIFSLSLLKEKKTANLFIHS